MNELLLSAYTNKVIEQNNELKKQLEAYENMRKEVLKELHKYNLDFYDKNDLINNSIDILNKVGGSDE